MNETLQLLESEAKRLRHEYSIASCNKWSVFDTAKAAKCDSTYARDYFMLSSHVHATISGIIAQEEQVSCGYIFQTAIFVILTSSGYTVQGVRTSTPQMYINEATNLLGIGIKLIRSGAFADK